MFDIQKTKQQVSSDLLDLLAKRRPDLKDQIQQAREELAAGAEQDSETPLFIVAQPGSGQTGIIKEAVAEVAEKLGMNAVLSGYELENITDYNPKTTLVFMVNEGADLMNVQVGENNTMTRLIAKRLEKAKDVAAVVQVSSFQPHDIDVGYPLNIFNGGGENEIRIGSISAVAKYDEIAGKIGSGLRRWVNPTGSFRVIEYKAGDFVSYAKSKFPELRNDELFTQVLEQLEKDPSLLSQIPRIEAFASPRSWMAFFQHYKGALDSDKPKDENFSEFVDELGKGFVGTAWEIVRQRIDQDGPVQVRKSVLSAEFGNNPGTADPDSTNKPTP